MEWLNLIGAQEAEEGLFVYYFAGLCFGARDVDSPRQGGVAWDLGADAFPMFYRQAGGVVEDVDGDDVG